MRILHINCNYIGTALHQLLIEKLDALGYDNKVFAPTYNKNLAVIVPRENVIVSECFKKWDRLIFDYKQKKIFKAVEDNYNIKNFDVIHAYTLFTDGNCARKLSEKYGVPYVVAIRNTDVNSFFRLMPHLRKRGIKTMLGAKAVFFLSESYRKQIFDKYVPKKYHEILKSKTYIIPNGIDDFWFNNPPVYENKIGDTIKLIYAGRIDRNKNISTTQKAMSRLREKGYKVSLTVVGKVADKKLFNEIKADPWTQCVSAMPKEKLITLYRENNIFVMPSFTESFGLVYVEAMSQGLPVVYSKGQGFDCQFDEGTVGYHVDASNVDNVEEGIQKILVCFNDIKKNVVSSAQKYNWREIASIYSKIYIAINGESAI